VSGFNNRHGIVAMSAAMLSFVVNDSLIKFVSASMDAPQLIFLRGLLASLGLILLSATVFKLPPWRESLGHICHRWVSLRSFLDGMASLVYLSALFNMPLANATAINMSTPLLIALLSALLLGQRVSGRHWGIIGAGFFGVLLVVQPQADGFNSWAWVALAGTLFHALRDLTVRFIPAHVPSFLVTLSTAITATLMAGLWAVWYPWQSVTWTQWGLMSAAAVFLSIGYFLLIKATRIADLSVIAPFRYMGLLAAVVIGFLVWSDVPNALAWAGMGLLVAAGLMMIHISRPPA
jgi:drug/metabolite transporter (DMT)-like permease